MTFEQEQRIKEMAAKCPPYQHPVNECGGALGCGTQTCEPSRPSLRERIQMDLARSRWESQKKDRLEELAFLLDKNPDMARIFDLMEDVRG